MVEPCLRLEMQPKVSFYFISIFTPSPDQCRMGPMQIQSLEHGWAGWEWLCSQFRVGSDTGIWQSPLVDSGVSTFNWETRYSGHTFSRLSRAPTQHIQTNPLSTHMEGWAKQKERQSEGTLNGHGHAWFSSVSVGLTGVLLFRKVQPGKRPWKDRARAHERPWSCVV